MDERRDRSLDKIRLLSAEQVGELLGRSARTITLWSQQARAGFPRPIRFAPDDKLMWRMSDLVEFVDRAAKNPIAKRPDHGGRLMKGKRRTRLRLTKA
jgi:predicted DNA-binding transcriptional regulator AlpA